MSVLSTAWEGSGPAEGSEASVFRGQSTADLWALLTPVSQPRGLRPPQYQGSSARPCPNTLYNGLVLSRLGEIRLAHISVNLYILKEIFLLLVFKLVYSVNWPCSRLPLGRAAPGESGAHTVLTRCIGVGTFSPFHERACFLAS